jgi:hypothetical protein
MDAFFPILKLFVNVEILSLILLNPETTLLFSASINKSILLVLEAKLYTCMNASNI